MTSKPLSSYEVIFLFLFRLLFFRRIFNPDESKMIIWDGTPIAKRSQKYAFCNERKSTRQREINIVHSNNDMIR